MYNHKRFFVLHISHLDGKERRKENGCRKTSATQNTPKTQRFDTAGAIDGRQHGQYTLLISKMCTVWQSFDHNQPS